MEALARDQYWMAEALACAKKASDRQEVPVGAVLVYQDEIIGRGSNAAITTVDPTAHAEIMALRAGAKKLGNYRLIDTTLYVTLEPCLMCAGAMIHARIARLVYGAADPRTGAIDSQCHSLEHPFLNHRVASIGGVMAAECGQLLKTFFQLRRSK